MAARRLYWQLMPSYLLLIVVALLAVTAFARDAVRTFHFQQVRENLEIQARLIESHLAHLLAKGRSAELGTLSKVVGERAGLRLTIVRADGSVLVDSHRDPRTMDDHGTRPEIRTAYRGEVGSSTRFSHTLQQHMMYVALPESEVDGQSVVVRTAVPLADVHQAVNGILVKLALGGVAVALLAAGICLVLSRRLTHPLEEMTEAVGDFAQGNFERRVPVPATFELRRLADSINWMASQLDEKVAQIVVKHNEENAVLSSMTEGVLAVAPDERVLNLNQAAANLMDVDRDAVRGRTIQEVVRNVDLQRFVREVFVSHEPIETEIVLHGDETRYLQAHGTIMRNANGEVLGALVVLHDITRLRRLENVRRDFVANVSHELKTPITTIKGFVETLLNGALEDSKNSRRFLQIISKHADRLSAIIEDLLSLSRLEQENERGVAVVQESHIGKVLHAAAEICEPKALSKDVSLRVECDPELTALINPPLLQQAVANLVDNAIKYSEPHSEVKLRAAHSEQHTIVSVEDHGCGIDEKHLSRLFERFYRVDKARSRELGGTGLGLAIVKHIAQAHNGRVVVDSKVGEGSTFAIYLPRQTEEKVA